VLKEGRAMTATDDVACRRELLKAELEEEIRRLIMAGATEGALIAVVAHLAGQFPDITNAELSAVVQEAMAEAEKRALRPQ
jgi:hypothetical protein